MASNQCFVAHIDILGMRHLVMRDPALAWKLISGLAISRNAVNSLSIRLMDSNQTHLMPEHVHSVTFSDTILLFTGKDSDADLRLLLIATTEILHKSLSHCVPIRVGIAHGTFYFNLDEDLYLGPALIEAYDTGEEAQWIGIRTTEVVYQRALAIPFQSGTNNVVIPSSIPLREGDADGFAVDWPRIAPYNIEAALPLTPQTVYAGFEKFFGPYSSLSEEVRRKYTNTANFINARLGG